MEAEREKTPMTLELDGQFENLESNILIADKISGEEIVQGIETINGIVKAVNPSVGSVREKELLKKLITRQINNYKNMCGGLNDDVAKGLIMGENIVNQYYEKTSETSYERNTSSR